MVVTRHSNIDIIYSMFQSTHDMMPVASLGMHSISW